MAMQDLAHEISTTKCNLCQSSKVNDVVVVSRVCYVIANILRGRGCADDPVVGQRQCNTSMTACSKIIVHIAWPLSAEQVTTLAI
jgi:hypothetical protein